MGKEHSDALCVANVIRDEAEIVANRPRGLERCARRSGCAGYLKRSNLTCSSRIASFRLNSRTVSENCDITAGRKER